MSITVPMLTGGCRMTLADVRKNIDRVDKEIRTAVSMYFRARKD